MKRLLFFSVFFLFLTGCDSELTFNEIKLKNAEKEVRTFFESVEDTNGAHVYFEGEKVIYVMLNGKNVKQEEKAIHFSHFRVISEGENLNIHYTKDETENYTDETLKHQIVYKVNLDRKYEKVQSIQNGSAAPFDTVSGNH